MKIKLLSVCVLLLVAFSLNAQQMFYYYNGQKVNLEVDKSMVNIVTDNYTVSTSEIKKIGIEYSDTIIDKSTRKIKFTTMLTEKQYSDIVSNLKQNSQIKVCPYFARNNAASIGTSDIFLIKLRNDDDIDLLQSVTLEKKVQIVRQVAYMPLWYILSIQNSSFNNSVMAANYFYETGKFADVDPAFMFNFRTSCVNDPMFNQQWGISKINVCNAWTITRGSGIKIAIVDQGIDRTHNDLSANMHSLSFDCQSGTTPSRFTNSNYHGTHVAGIVGAIRNNSLQVVGVAPEAKIIGISNDLNLRSTTSAELASGISWAKQNGADIITNSWGDQGGQYYNNMHSVILENAIIDAINTGRGGKGCVVTFAAGNYGNSSAIMDYPAYFYDNILTVGSITSSNSRSSFSGYGDKLDVVAPGSGILSTLPNNSIGSDNGTSMACPHVAGVAALVLSVNPNLTGQQVRDIIESTAQKVGGYSYQTTSGHPNGTWNNQMGYGLVNAYEAVKKAAVCNTTTVTGTQTTNKVVCDEIIVRDATVPLGVSLELQGGSVKIYPGFKVESGATFTIK